MGDGRVSSDGLQQRQEQEGEREDTTQTQTVSNG